MSDQFPPVPEQPQPYQQQPPQPQVYGAPQAPAQPDVRYGAPAPKPKRNPVVIWLSVVAGVLAIALVVVIGLLVTGAGAGAPAASPSVSATPSATDAGPTPTPTPTTDPVAARPTECAQLFPAGYIESITAEGQTALNPAWTEATIDTDFIGSNDGVLQDFLSTTADRLNCTLAKASGGGDFGIITNVAWVDAARQAAALARMSEAGFTCNEESGGTMCFTESSTEAGDSGERHFLRDGTWVATRWANTNITGWTQTIVATLFPG